MQQIQNIKREERTNVDLLLIFQVEVIIYIDNHWQKGPVKTGQQLQEPVILW
jgi:hypothetical protein